jgi:hypothetical protein
VPIDRVLDATVRTFVDTMTSMSHGLDRVERFTRLDPSRASVRECPPEERRAWRSPPSDMKDRRNPLSTFIRTWADAAPMRSRQLWVWGMTP